MSIAPKPRRPKKCDNPVCATSFVPFRMGQFVCSPACGFAFGFSGKGTTLSGHREGGRPPTELSIIQQLGDPTRDEFQVFIQLGQ